jgi:hypothetical protein
MRFEMVSRYHYRLFVVFTVLAAGAGILPAADAAKPDFVKSWTVSDFEALLSVGLEGYRDHENGRRGFARGRCVKCHRLAGEGPEKGISLDKAGERHDPRSLLALVLSPAHPGDREGASRRFGVEPEKGGYLDGFEEEDVLDLLAYLVAGGEAGHPAFAK